MIQYISQLRLRCSFITAWHHMMITVYFILAASLLGLFCFGSNFVFFVLSCCFCLICCHILCIGICFLHGRPLDSLHRAIFVNKYATAGIMRTDDGGRVSLMCSRLSHFHWHITYSQFTLECLMTSATWIMTIIFIISIVPAVRATALLSIPRRDH